MSESLHRIHGVWSIGWTAVALFASKREYIMMFRSQIVKLYARAFAFSYFIHRISCRMPGEKWIEIYEIMQVVFDNKNTWTIIQTKEIDRTPAIFFHQVSWNRCVPHEQKKKCDFNHFDIFSSVASHANTFFRFFCIFGSKLFLFKIQLTPRRKYGWYNLH